MAMTSDTVSSLNELIETLQDGKQGFETAAAEVNDAAVKSEFEQFAQQRSRFAGELEAEVKQLGGDPDQNGSATGAVHRGWMSIKGALGAGEKSILAEAERGEDATVKSFEKAMSQTLPPGVASIVQRQFIEVKKAHDRVRNLRDSWK
ncbi:MAG TPA: PA2169 family four-helix-bundle protein [Tepidisphaeraceae bacterium]|jgi:uncharacterized protein (TIGR02284 family)|nr:PA2169 family four-helix-bundle protein [Tepidisphaeraceae bacterium]